MKIISSFMDDLVLTRNQCHSIYFESSKMQMQFRELLKSFFTNKKMEDHYYLDVIDHNYNSIASRSFYFIDFDCFSIDLKNEKDTSKIILDLLKYELEHNAEWLAHYTNYLTITDRFLSQLELTEEALVIDFQMTDKTIEALLKSLLVTIEYDNSTVVGNHKMRAFLIKAMLKLNLTEKEVVLFVSYPEVDVGYQDYKEVVQFLEQLGVTTIILSSNEYYLTHPPMDSIFLVNKNGKCYDIPFLFKELEVFGLLGQKSGASVAKKLAYKDFTQRYELLDLVYKEFLESNRK